MSQAFRLLLASRYETSFHLTQSTWICEHGIPLHYEEFRQRRHYQYFQDLRYSIQMLRPPDAFLHPPHRRYFVVEEACSLGLGNDGNFVLCCFETNSKESQRLSWNGKEWIKSFDNKWQPRNCNPILYILWRWVVAVHKKLRHVGCRSSFGCARKRAKATWPENCQLSTWWCKLWREQP